MTLTKTLMEIIAEEERAQAAKEWAEAETTDKRWTFAAPEGLTGDYVPVGHPALDPALLPLPDSNPKTAFGTLKASFHCIPPVALVQLGAVCKNGADKYGVMNWREHAVTYSVYHNAILRHLFAIQDGEWLDPESGLPHLAHIMAGASILLDAHYNNKLNDDRPKLGGKAPEMMRKK